jgi:hypothetical protein
MKIINDYTPKHREYFKVRILDTRTRKEITTVKVGKNESLSEAIRNIARNMGYLRSEITHEFV